MAAKRCGCCGRLMGLAWWAGWCVLGLGWLLHLTIRDRVDGLAVVFYALPLPVLAVVAIVLGLWRSVATRTRLTAFTMALAAVAVWCARSWHWHEVKPSAAGAAGEFRALCWNLGRPAAPSTDLIALV